MINVIDYFRGHSLSESELLYYRYDVEASRLYLIFWYTHYTMTKTESQALLDRDYEVHKLIFSNVKKISRKVTAHSYKGIEIYDADKGMSNNAIYDTYYSQLDGLHRFQAQLTNFGKLDVLFADMAVEKRRLKYDERESEDAPCVYRDTTTGEIVEGMHPFEV